MSDLGNKEIFAKNLRRYMEWNDKDRSQVCRDLKLSYSTVNEWYNGNKYPRIDKIELLANYFGVKKSDLIEDKPLPLEAIPVSPIKLKKIPILGRIAAGTPIWADENIEGYTYTDRNGGAEYFALRIRGDSMNAARIQDGDLVIVRRQEEIESGEIGAVLINRESATVKQCLIDGPKLTLVPKSFNLEHVPMTFDLRRDDVRILGRVVEVKISM